MKEKIFTDEQLGMLADCVLAQIKAWSRVGDSVPNREKLYSKYDVVRLISFPTLFDCGTYIWEVK